MKICKYCGDEKPDDMFDICRVVGGKSYRRLKCRTCKRRDKNDRRKRIREWLDEYKKELVCRRCSFDDFRALTFHHHGNSGKDFNIADMLSAGLSIRSILNEIEKCEVLCANCHQIEHYRETL